MKRLTLSLIYLSLTTAQLFATQSGVPVKLTTKSDGKEIPGFLQGIEKGKLIFQKPGKDQNIPLPKNKISKLTFLSKSKERPLLNQELLNTYFSKGEYSSLITEFDVVFSPYWDYMDIENNLQQPFLKLIDSYLHKKSFDKVKRAGKILIKSSNKDLLLKGHIYIAMAELSNVDTNGVVLPSSVKIVKEIQEKMPAVAGELYLQACIDRAKGNPKAAFSNLCTIIVTHGNDMRWMPDAELLCAYLYLDSHLTNSAIGVAKQVKSIYGGSNVAVDADLILKEIAIAQVEAKKEKIRTDKASKDSKAALEKRVRNIAPTKRPKEKTKNKSNVTKTKPSKVVGQEAKKN